ncbi:poly-gamma-glutamate synthase PgsB [Clostridium vitabionis]|uniref:poly-gamma-glutamate synthase PgsB n=1 Tax=Clostridium vitabionis TaxID=2784388 RepID=UPI00188B6030|nr:poly-gamma-glutamate synthase PgsB [Clostridium vitabionis]
MSVFLIFSGIYLLYLLWENFANRRARRSFLHVIHVNGIRGKTSTCRTLDAVLRTRYRVFTKTTGTDAAVIDVSGREMPLRRLGPANLHEQLRIIRRAKREGAEILILECMAVNPELQKAAQEKIVRSDISVITNVRYDHTFEMGDTLEEIANSLSAVIPDGGTLISADPAAERYFSAACREKGTRLIEVSSDPESRDAGTSRENIAIAMACARLLGVPEEEARRALPEVRQDFGVLALYTLPGNVDFLNLFSVNDPQSTETNLRHSTAPEDGDRLVFLYNHRQDRPDRAVLFARHFIPHYPEVPVYVTGSGASLAARLFRRAGAGNVRIVPGKQLAAANLRQSLPGLPDHALVCGIGNIKGTAYRLIQEMDAPGRKERS